MPEMDVQFIRMLYVVFSDSLRFAGGEQGMATVAVPLVVPLPQPLLTRESV